MKILTLILLIFLPVALSARGVPVNPKNVSGHSNIKSLKSSVEIKSDGAESRYSEREKYGVITDTTKTEEKISNVNDSDVDTAVYSLVEEMPEFPGGQSAMFVFIKNNLSYPQEAIKLRLQGIVVVNFIIRTDGKIINPKILHSVGSTLDAEALRVINKMPYWKPGKDKGKAVNVSFTMPLRFKLQ